MKINLYLIILTVIFLLNSCSFKDDYQQISHEALLKTHRYNIGQTTFLYNGTTRKRPLKTEVWYPTADTTKANVTLDYPFKLTPTSKNADIIPAKFPLILLPHGTGGNRISLMWLACELAANGYIVAAVDHWGNTHDNKIPENFVKAWDRPLDISFILDKLLIESQFKTRINSNKIGMAGFSLGGYTTIALAGGRINYTLEPYS
jgi:predicted dienelactone hydrolase